MTELELFLNYPRPARYSDSWILITPEFDWVIRKGVLVCEIEDTEKQVPTPRYYQPVDAEEFHLINAEMSMRNRIYLADCGCAECKAVEYYQSLQTEEE